ncbi:hypothetical protein BU25DRAFT_413107 [Macroventuria anomochaeta]|uniref:Uncharacterized protein n=1 Tax=Macroventuria anomochaeta TaxID=301207 RepID=A0ACB6RSQ6_9PLEO|nr:uncharacterized protein BU25DRAFT_413107 [Macroventuria anomochaeta]KAF2624931.1 hypothetical protein BU25DRAFT_413107 [Macroventuria anomochaeta]
MCPPPASQHDERHLLWIDALCINRGDTEERGQRAQLMGDILVSAEHVTVWLGTERSNDQYIVDNIKHR